MSTTGDSETTGTTELAPSAAQHRAPDAPAPASESTIPAEVPENSTVNRRQGFGQGFLDAISTGWAERPEIVPPAREQAAFAARRRDAVSAAFPGRRLVVP